MNKIIFWCLTVLLFGHQPVVLKEISFSKGFLEIVHPVHWEMSAPISVRIWDESRVVFRSASFDYIFPQDMNIELNGEYKVIEANNCLALVHEYRGESTAVVFYAFDIDEGYPKVYSESGMHGKEYYYKILNRWEAFCAESGMDLKLYDFPSDILETR